MSSGIVAIAHKAISKLCKVIQVKMDYLTTIEGVEKFGSYFKI
jgi:hypothetical protein